MAGYEGVSLFDATTGAPFSASAGGAALPVTFTAGQDIGYTTDILIHKIALGEARIAGFDVTTNGTTLTTAYVSLTNPSTSTKNVYVFKYDLYCSTGTAKITYKELITSDANAVVASFNPVIGQSGAANSVVRAGTAAPVGGTTLSGISLASSAYPTIVEALFIIAPGASVLVQTTPSSGTGAEIMGNLYFYEE